MSAEAITKAEIYHTNGKCGIHKDRGTGLSWQQQGSHQNDVTEPLAEPFPNNLTYIEE